MTIPNPSESAGGAAAPKKKKPKSSTNLNGDAADPAKPKSVKKKKKSVTAGEGAPVKQKKKATIDGSAPKKPASKKTLVSDKVPASPTPTKSALETARAGSPVPPSPSSKRVSAGPGIPVPALGSPSKSGSKPASMRTIPRPTPTGGSGRGPAANGAGRSMRNMNGGRGRGAPSSRNVARNASYDAAQKPGSVSNINAPRRPQSMAQLSGVPVTDRPGSMRGGFGRTSERNLGRGRGPMGRGLKPLGPNAVSNRNLPPPPGTRNKSSRGLLGSFHRTSSHRYKHQSSKSSSNLSSDDDDDEDEFGEDLADNVDSAERGQKSSSILRKASRGNGGTSRRMNVDGSITLSQHSTHFSIDEDEDYANEDEFAEAKPIVSRMPSTQRPTMMKKPGLGANDSEHSMRGWTQSFRWGNNDNRGGRGAQVTSDYDASKSVRSLLTVDMEYEDEPLWKQFLRYIRILAPHPDEKPVKKSIRIFTWLAMVLDFCTALVSISQYNGVTECCGAPILSIAGDINWGVAIQTTVYLYIVMIFAEIIPVMRHGFPFHLMNPFMGFLITFATFFTDTISVAVTMWVIEAAAVTCEFYVYRLRLRWHNQRQARLDKTDVDLKALRTERRRRKQTGSTHSMDSVDSDLSLDDKSFHDESNGSSSEVVQRPKDISQIRETRLLRERRLLRQAQSDDTRELRHHMIGVTFNVFLVFFSLLLIVMIGRSGGLCIVDMIPPNIFKTGQLEKCYDCKGTSGTCQVCRDDGTSHCYYPYY